VAVRSEIGQTSSRTSEGDRRLPANFRLFERVKAQGWRGLLVPTVFVLAFLAVIMPILAALLIAHRQSFMAERQRAQALAAEVERRAEATSTQAISALRELEAPPAHQPCSPEGMQRMASAVLEYEQIQGSGYLDGNRLICTAAGLLPRPIDLGPPQFYTTNHYSVRNGITLPFAPDVGLIVLGAPSGYAMFVHPRLTLDIPLADKREAIGVIGVSVSRLVNHRGPVEMELLRPFYATHRTSFVAKDRLVAIRPSTKGDYAGFAILPIDETRNGMGRYLLYLLPIGLVCGGALIFLLRILVRSENSLATIAKRALKTDEFYLRYQPLVELQTGRWIGCEALVRWRRPTGEEMRPDLFIPYLEEAGMITLLTDKLFELLAADIGGDLKGREDFYVSINIASEDLRGDRLMDRIETLLSRTGCGAHYFAVEATERGLIDAEGGSQALQAARSRGICVALDDFGTGYSSLAYLQKFPLDYIKIDKSFVDSIATGAATSRVVSHIINMAHDLKLGIIAEGVETEEQCRFLIKRGVAYGQGWLFARPMPWAQIKAGLDAQAASPDHVIPAKAAIQL
jgi:sensor c-di-GMP phosphodiesterase-like protein